MNQFADPADSAAACYVHHPVDDIEPETETLNGGTERALSEVLWTIATAGQSAPVVAFCFLRLADRLPYSEQRIAGICGVSKAWVSKVARMLERRYGVKAAGGRTEEAIEKFRRLAKGRQRSRPLPWEGELQWKQNYQ